MSKRLAAAAALLTAAVFASDYNEPFRPQYHFSPRANWTNDPCGLVWAFGRFQFFFQHNPFENKWGHMSWGHASSPDLVHWTQMPVAIPTDETVAIYTGSSVFDRNNTSGFCTNPAGCIVSIWTGRTPKTATAAEKQTQNVAYSNDGVTWTKYAQNPVLDLGRSDTRDPKVFWYEAGKYWVMVIVKADEKKVALFRSPNLKNWTPISEFGPAGGANGQWECPDLYAIPITGEPGKMRWILKIGLNPGHIAGGSGEQYFIGQFDGTKFTPDEVNGAIHWLDYGRDCYCEFSFNNDKTPGAPHAIGWMNDWLYAGKVPTEPWKGQMTLPRELALAKVNGSLQIVQHPARELASLRGEHYQYSGATLPKLNQKLANWPHRTQSYELEADIALGNAKNVQLRVLNDAVISYDREKGELAFDRTHSGTVDFSPKFPYRAVAPLKTDHLKLHVFVDHDSVEIFAQDGAVVLTNLVFPKPDATGISLQADAALQNADVRLWNLRSIWQ